MFPYIWRDCLKSYLRCFLLSIGAFIAVLLVTRFQEIARFTALSSTEDSVLFFVLYQFPLILPIAIPISAFIATWLVFQRRSEQNELIACRTSGISLITLFAPLLGVSFLLCLLNFSLCSTLSPYCQSQSKAMIYDKSSSNPLLLLQRQHLVRLKHAHLTMESSSADRVANLTLIAYHKKNECLNILQAQELTFDGEAIHGKSISLLSPSSSHFALETQQYASCPATFLADLLKKKPKSQETGALALSTLFERAKGGIKANACYLEIFRRLSLSLAPFSFSLLGCSFGSSISKRFCSKNRFQAAVLALLFLAGYLSSKEVKKDLFLAALLVFIPHLLMWMFSAKKTRQITRGSM